MNGSRPTKRRRGRPRKTSISPTAATRWASAPSSRSPKPRSSTPVPRRTTSGPSMTTRSPRRGLPAPWAGARSSVRNPRRRSYGRGRGRGKLPAAVDPFTLELAVDFPQQAGLRFVGRALFLARLGLRGREKSAGSAAGAAGVPAGGVAPPSRVSISPRTTAGSVGSGPVSSCSGGRSATGGFGAAPGEDPAVPNVSSTLLTTALADAASGAPALGAAVVAGSSGSSEDENGLRKLKNPLFLFSARGASAAGGSPAAACCSGAAVCGVGGSSVSCPPRPQENGFRLLYQLRFVASS